MRDDRFKRLVHYVCWRCADDPSKLGAVKLNKILWLAEQENYYRNGKPLTTIHYVKEKYGPVPDGIVTALQELHREGKVVEGKADHFGFEKKQFIVKKSAPTDFLETSERKIVDEMIRYVTERHTASSISNESHDNIWKAAAKGEVIPHYTVFAKHGPITQEELEWAKFELSSES
jgi:hypothetical protein